MGLTSFCWSLKILHYRVSKHPRPLFGSTSNQDDTMSLHFGPLFTEIPLWLVPETRVHPDIPQSIVNLVSRTFRKELALSAFLRFHTNTQSLTKPPYPLWPYEKNSPPKHNGTTWGVENFQGVGGLITRARELNFHCVLAS